MQVPLATPRRVITLLTLPIVTAALPWGSACAEGPDWVRDLQAGRAAAEQSGKPLLINFTGHGWCGHCMDLDREVFQQPAFVSATRGRLVLVELDFTFGDSEEEEARQAKLRGLQDRFAVRGFPTVVLADGMLRPFACFIGYDSGAGPAPYLERIESALDSQRSLAAAESAGRADTLAAALVRLADQLEVHDRGESDPLLTHYADELERVVTGLPDENPHRRRLVARRDAQRLREQRAAAWRPVIEGLQPYYDADDLGGAIAFIDESDALLEDPELRRRLLLRRLSILRQADRYEEALGAARAIHRDEGFDNETRRRVGNTESSMLLKLNRIDEAIARYDERIAAAGAAGDTEQRAWLLSWKLQMLVHADRLEETLATGRACRGAFRRGSEDWATATFIMALGLRKAGRFREALELSLEQHDADPQPYALIDIAESLIGLRRFGDATRRLAEAESEAAKLRESPRQGDRDFAVSIVRRVGKLREDHSQLE